MKLQPNEMPNGLLFALRLTEISRWGIVATSRQQSVGEHSYRVTMIAQALYDYVFTVPHNSNDRHLLTSFAMVHDIMEVLSGDLDAVFKLAVKSRYPDVFANTIGSMATQRLDAGPLATTVASLERSVKGTFIEALVKMADFLEALVYLDQYGTHSRHMGNVRDTILEHLWGRVEQFKRSSYYGVDVAHWQRVETFINLVLNSPGLQEKSQRQLINEMAVEQGKAVAEARRGVDTGERFENEYRG
jgi:5'-deoxynucleotidase YfbR-like HD superfamily hydrolase